MTFGLKNIVGNNMKNEELDVFAVKQELFDRDYYKKKPENGFMDWDLDKGIKLFQRDHDLKIDGIIEPPR